MTYVYAVVASVFGAFYEGVEDGGAAADTGASCVLVF